MVAASPSAAAIEHSRLFSKQHSDGGWGLVPIQSRVGRFRSFKAAEFEPVSGFETEWKYTPIKLIDPLLNGALVGEQPKLESRLEGGASLNWVGAGNPLIGSVGIPEERGSANAWSQIAGAHVLTLDGTDCFAEIARTGEGSALATHLVVRVSANSKANVVLKGTGAGSSSDNVEIHVGEGAELTLVTIQDWDDSYTQLSTHFIKLDRDSIVRHVVVSLGGAVVRLNTSVHLAGQGSEAELLGVYFADEAQHLEHQVFANHDAPNTKSRVNYRGALNGLGARTVWVGDVLIRPTATGTDSYEENRNLLLSEGARADSVPNLEIETGEIIGAGHASASGRFDDEQLFYLQARGIPEEIARRLVVEGFLSGVVQRIGIPDIEAALIEAIRAELSRESG